MIYRQAKIEDSRTLAELNHQLIRDEGHWNPMTVPELENRMRDWLADVYRAIIFQGDEDILAYALYREDDTLIYLRQFFVIRNRRRQGIGRRAMDILRHETWPRDKRLMVEVLWKNTGAIEFWKAVGFDEYSLTLEMKSGE